MKRDFKGVWVPAGLYLAQGLSWPEKLIILEVFSFQSNALPCWVSNEHLATFCQVSTSTVEKSLAKLVAAGYIERTKRKENGKWTRFLRVDSRKIDGLTTVKAAREQPQNLRTTNNNIPIQPNNPKKEARPSNLGQVIEAFEKVGSTSDEAAAFFDYYSANGWTQGRGKQIKDWRAAARNWLRRAAEYNKNKTQTHGFNPSSFDGHALAEYLRNGAQ